MSLDGPEGLSRSCPRRPGPGPGPAACRANVGPTPKTRRERCRQTESPARKQPAEAACDHRHDRDDALGATPPAPRMQQPCRPAAYIARPASEQVTVSLQPLQRVGKSHSYYRTSTFVLPVGGIDRTISGNGRAGRAVGDAEEDKPGLCSWYGSAWPARAVMPARWPLAVRPARGQQPRSCLPLCHDSTGLPAGSPAVPAGARGEPPARPPRQPS